MSATKPALHVVHTEVTHLNAVLKNELTAINQYFLHARMLKHKGFLTLADQEYRESINAMKYADMLVERILALGGAPNLQALGALHIGDDVASILRGDMQLENTTSEQLKAAIAFCQDEQGAASIDMLRRIADSHEEHMVFIRAQLKLIDEQGLSAYLQNHI